MAVTRPTVLLFNEIASGKCLAEWLNKAGMKIKVFTPTFPG